MDPSGPIPSHELYWSPSWAGLARDLNAHILTSARSPEEIGFAGKAITIMLSPEDAAEWVLNQN